MPMIVIKLSDGSTLTDECWNPISFETVADAKQFLRDEGYSEDYIEDCTFPEF